MEKSRPVMPDMKESVGEDNKSVQDDTVATQADTWYHGSPFELTELRTGSTITRWRELAEAFSHKPTWLSYDTVGGNISHNGQVDGFLYVVDEPLIAGSDIYKHPHTSMDDGVEWLTKRPVKVRKIGSTRWRGL